MTVGDSHADSLQGRVLEVVRPPADLVVVAVAGGLLALVAEMGINPGGPVRGTLALAVLLVLPGYLLVATLYPRQYAAEREEYQPRLAERAALSFGFSVVLLAVFALIPPLVDHPYGPRTLLTIVEVGLGVGIALAWYRRKSVPESERLRLGLGTGVTRLSAWVGETTPRRGVIRSALVVSVILAAASLTMVLVVPQDGEQYTTMTLFSESESNTLVAGSYPQAMTANEPTEFTLQLQNDRGERQQYTVVVRLERVAIDGDSQQVVAAEQLRTLEASLAAGQTWRGQHAVRPTMTGENLRLRYYLYRGEPPGTVGPGSAADYLHLWLDVEAA